MNKDRLNFCHDTIRPHIHRTPVLTSKQLNDLSGAELFFKCENFQRMGAFKMRGATFAISQLSEKERSKGVVTHSSGNFAQALSLAAKALGVKAYIVMPDNAPEVKKAAVKGYGGEIILCPPNNKDREETAARIQQESGATFIHPSNDADVITGQGTAAKELLEDYPDIEILIAPVGGGGLIAGTIIAAQSHNQPVKVFGGEPFAVDDAYRSLQSGNIESNTSANTIADGLKTQLGDINFPIIQDGIETIIRVEEAEIVQAMRLIWERMKIIIEPSCAVPLAAILREPQQFKNKKVGVILSGGNVDLSQLPF
jgi:threonine dehydratase